MWVALPAPGSVPPRGRAAKQGLVEAKMYEYLIAVPLDRADEVENVLRGEADIQRRGTIPAPESMAADEAYAIAAGSPLAILWIQGPTLQSVSSLKNWLDQRWSEPYVDVRAETSSGAYEFSFRSHSAEEIKDWIQARASSKPPSG